METKIKLFEYGKSFVQTYDNADNTPRFLIESRCIINDRGKTDAYYLVSSCKGENTYDKHNLFKSVSYLLYPVFHEKETLTFRKFKYFKNGEVGEYKKTHKEGTIWGKRKFLLKEIDGELLDTSEKIVKAVKDGRCLIGRLKIKKGIEVIIDFPIKTINVHDDQWQVDTGYILYPEFYKYPVERISSLSMGFIAFSNLNIVEVMTEGITQLIEGSDALFICNDKDISRITNPDIHIYAV